MIFRRVLVLALISGAIVLGQSTTAFACTEDADLTTVSQTCDKSSSELEAEKVNDPTARWSARQICKDGGRRPDGVCFNPAVCTTAAGVPGTRYTMYRNGEYDSTACLSADEYAKVDDPPPVREVVLQVFEDLEWPASQLSVQPKGGRTLVNLETNFFTTNSRPTNIPVDLMQQTRVVVTARPIAYRWHFGDGSTITTTGPGAPYPALDVSHAYLQTDEVLVSVDTQYGDASFTVNGGPPESIPSTIWVEGETEDLAIVEALPQLVIR